MVLSQFRLKGAGVGDAWRGKIATPAPVPECLETWSMGMVCNGQSLECIEYEMR